MDAVRHVAYVVGACGSPSGDDRACLPSGGSIVVVVGVGIGRESSFGFFVGRVASLRSVLGAGEMPLFDMLR